MSKLLRPVLGVVRGVQVRSGSSGSLNSWHHGPDSPSLPPVDHQAVTLVNMRFCPYAQRTALCLNAKNVQYDVINSQLRNKPSWLLELNPFGRVPVLIHDGNTIYESLVTCEYIEVRVGPVLVIAEGLVLKGSFPRQKVALRGAGEEGERQNVGGTFQQSHQSADEVRSLGLYVVQSTPQLACLTQPRQGSGSRED